MKNWINKHYKSLIIGAFLIPIITVAIVSISHVTKWYGISNPLSWSVYLSIGIEIAALSALAAISADMGKKVYFPFAIVTIIQFIGNIFFAYSYIDLNSQGFKDWVDLVSPLVSFMGVEPTDFIGHKRFLAFFAGGMLPIISLSFLHMLVKFTEEDRIKEQENLNKVPVEDKINASDLISEVSRIRLSEDDLKKLEETLLNPPKPNENLKSAAFYYKSKVEESNTLKTQEENKNHKVNDKPISREETELVFKSRVDLLSEIMQKDEELGLYNETFDKPLVKEPIVSDDFTIGPDGAFEMTEEIQQELNQQQITPALSDEEVREMFMDEWERKFDLVEEEEFSTTEPTEEEESRNFSTITTNTENIFQDNTEDYEGQFQDWGIETVPEPFATIEEIQNPITNSVEPTEVEVPSSDEVEKKN